MSNVVGPQASLPTHLVAPATPRHRAASAVAVAVLFALTSVFAYASPSRTFGWDNESFSSTSEAELVTLTNRAGRAPGSRRSRSTRR